MAGGKGTRLHPLTITLPKPLVPIANKPLLFHLIELLKKYEFDEIIITANTLGTQISKILGDGNALGVNIKYEWEEDPLGTAGGLKKFEEELNETFLVISGDILTNIDLSEMFSFHKKKNGIATLALTHVDVPTDYAIVTKDNSGRVIRFLEKPSWNEVFSNTINVGIYILEPIILDYLKKHQAFDFSRQLFPLLLEKGEPFFGYFTRNYWLDIGTPRRYFQANQDVMTEKIKVSLSGNEIKNKIWIGHGTCIDPEVQIKPPVIIGQNCIISKGCTIDELSIIGDGVFIGNFSNTKHSIIWNNALIHEEVKLNSCLIANKVEIGAKSVVEADAIIGENCKIGPDCIIKSAARIWPNTAINPNKTVFKDIK